MPSTSTGSSGPRPNTTSPGRKTRGISLPQRPDGGDDRDVYRGDLFFEPGHDFFYYGSFDVAYSSYAGNAGTWFQHSRDPSRLSQCNGLFYRASATRLADITDGMSNTIFYAEHAVSLLTDDTERIVEGPAMGGRLVRLDDLHVILSDQPPGQGERRVRGRPLSSVIGAVSSMHPGGANTAFVDGSVKFIKDTIDSWAVDPGTATPLGVTRDISGLFQLAPETRFHVWQVLTTRAGNEVVSASGF